VGGTCGCNIGLTNCSNTCIDTSSDAANCGACGTACASGKVCAGGSCVSASCVLFSETFADNSKGWILGSTWQIGPAQASTGQTFGNPDPATDHSPGSDNGVAGAVIGGNVPTTSHPAYYLTSPIVDTSGATSGVKLYFQRWLNTDLPGSNVEVFNGTKWIVVWSSSYSTTADASWLPQEIDLTPMSNAKLRVRFGYESLYSSPMTSSGWNIDDVSIVDTGCN